eukprot:6337664-Prorocentrum_lima.AAC.1
MKDHKVSLPACGTSMISIPGRGLRVPSNTESKKYRHLKIFPRVQNGQALTNVSEGKWTR